MNKLFNDYKFKDFIINNLNEMDIKEPTEIQSEAFPYALEGKDIIGKAKTGTGKTFAYLLPMIQNIDASQKKLQMVVLAPSRELSLQIHKEAKNIIKGTDIVVEAVVEGMDIRRQITKLKNKPQLIIATPGRLLHMASEKKVKFHEIKTIALDEVDQILKKGLKEKVLAVVKGTLKERQIVSFSATLSQEAKTVLEEIMQDPIKIHLDHAKPVPSRIKHEYIVSKAPTKTETLGEILTSIKPKKSLVFINKNENVDRFTKELKSLGFLVGGIQTRTKNQERQHLLDAFNKGKLRILVTTDLFTRGMDFKDVTNVFNMDLPLNNTDYLHRAGRTGRMNKEGEVINIVKDREKFIMYKMMKYLNIEVTPIQLRQGKIVTVKEIIEKGSNKE
ncbi:DEAD/DEAH box helicase [Lutibacter sp. B2]|nr:DEAD/DEAH box helicase [Lutibacter sp. B2]